MPLKLPEWELYYLGVSTPNIPLAFSIEATCYANVVVGVGQDSADALRYCISESGLSENSLTRAVLKRYPSYRDSNAVKRAKPRKGQYCYVALAWDRHSKNCPWGQPNPVGKQNVGN